MWHECVSTAIHQELLIQLHRAHLKFAQPWHHGKVHAVQEFRVGITRACQRQKIAVPQDKLQIKYHSITSAMCCEQ